MNDQRKSKEQLVADVRALRSQLAECRQEMQALREREQKYRAQFEESRLRRARDEAGLGYQGLGRDVAVPRQAEEALKASQERFRILFQNAPFPTYVWQRKDDDFVFVNYNKAAEIVTQGQVAQAMGCLLRDRYPDVPEIPEAVERCYSEQTTLRHELRFRTRETRKVKDLVLTYAYAPADFVVIYTEDITARKQAEEQRQRLISLIENSADFIGLASMDRRSTYVNKAGLAMVGLDSMEEARKKKVDDFLLEDDHARFDQEIMPVLMEGKTWRGEFRLGHFKTGKPVPIDASVFIIQNEADGQPVAIATVSRDITERKRAETALRTSEERFRVLFESSPLPTYVWQRKDGDFVLTGYNSAGAVIIRESVEMGVGSLLSEIYHDRPDITEHFERCFTSREPLQQETTYRFRTTGEVRDLAMYYAYVPPDLVMVHTEDVTERKQAQEALRKSKEKFATVFRSSPVSVMIIAFEDGRLLDVNKRFLNVTGYRYEEVVGSTTRALELWGDPREHARMAELVRRQVKLRNFETDFRTKTGEVRTGRLSLSLIDLDGESCLLSVLRDITKQKQAEAALRTSEETARALLNAYDDVAFLMDTEGTLLLANHSLAQRFDKQIEELLGSNVYDLSPPQIVRHRKAYAEEVVRTGKPDRFQDGRAGRLFDNQVYPVMDAEGKVARLAVYTRDITEQAQMEENLRKSEERFRALFQGVPLPTYVWQRKDDDFVLAGYNAASEVLTEGGVETVVGSVLSEMYRDRPDIIEHFERCFASREPLRQEMSYRLRTTGEVRDLAVYYAYVPPDLVMMHTEDVTERKRAQEALRESEEKFRTIVETSTDWIWEMDLEWRHTFSNRRYEDILGYSWKAIEDQDIFALFHPEDRVVIEERLPGLIENQAGWQNWVVRFRHEDGSYRFLESSAVPVLDTDGKLIGYRGVDRDITARKLAEEALRLSEERCRAIVEDQTELISRFKADGTLTFINEAAWRYVGLPREQLIGKSFFYMLPPDYREELQNVLASLGPDNPVVEMENQVVLPDGRVRWTQWINRAILNEAGTVVEFQAVGRDITEHKQAEEALRASEERNRAMVEAMPDLMFRMTTDGTFLDFKAEADRLLMAPDELVGSTLADSPMPSDVVEAITRAMRQAVETGEVATLEYELAMPNGLRFFEARVVKSGDEEVIAFVRDITERKRAEEALRASEERLQLATEAAKIGCFDWHLPEGQLHWDTQMHKLFGLHPQSTIDRADYFNALLHPDDKERVAAEFGESMDPENGETVFRSEFKVVLEEGLEKHIESHAIHFKDESGVVKRIIGTCLDITGRKQMEAELRKSRERLRQVIENMPVLLDAFDEAGHIVTWNKECERVTGYSAEEVIGEPEAIGWLYPDAVYRERMMTELERQGSDFRDWEWELVSKTGQVKTVAWSNISEHFPISGWASWGIGVDVTERRQAEENLRASQERFKALFQGIPIPTYVWQQKDDEIIFVDYNVAAETFTQRRVEEYQGIRIVEMYAGQPDIIEDMKRCFTNQEAIRREMTYRFTTGEARELAVHYAFVPPDLVMLHTEDITERRRAERALRESEARLREAQHMAHLGSWEFDVATETLLWSNEMYAIHGISQEVSAGNLIEAGKRAVHPDDLEVLLASIERTMAGESPSEHEFRVVHPDGTERVVLGRATCTWDDEGRPIRLAGTVQDITERKQAEEALRHYAERLKVLHIIDQAILNAHSSEEIARAVMPHLPAILPIGCAGVWVFDFEANEARLLATLLEEQAPLRAGATVPLSDLGNIEAFRQGRETLIHDTTQAEGLARGDQALMEDGWRSILCVPLRVQDGIVGIIKAVSRRPHIFTADHVAIAYEVADELGVALHSIRLFEEVSVARQRLMQLSRRLAMVQEEERRLLARELHDEVGGLLTALQISLKMNPAKEEEARRELHEASLLVDSLIEQARQLALKLRPAVLDDMGLVPALHWLFERYTARVKVEVDFHNEVPPDTRFAPEVETTVYRITQEALTNVARHTGVKRVQVLLHVEAQHLALHVIDEGNGFDVKEALTQEKTLGVSGMRERAALLGGTLTIESDSGVGTCVSALLPLE